MSLLMKALEKAAKDREDADAGRESTAPAGNAAKSELTLEPVAVPAAPREAAASPAPSSPTPALAPAARSASSPAPSVKPAATATPASATPESMLAATVVRASEHETGGGLATAVGYVREHPLIAFGPLAALAAIGYGTYVYLQLTNPGVLTKSAPRPAPATTPAPAPPGAPSLALSPGDSASAVAKPLIPLAALLPPTPEAVLRERTAVAPAAAVPQSRTAAAPPQPAPAPAAPAAAPAVRDTIKVTTGGETPTVNPMLARAYEVFSSGDHVLAPQLYNRVLLIEPNNIDALLALAAIATQQGDSNLASRHYMRVLEVEPRNALAQAGLIGMLGRADPLAAESRLKQLIAREPSAYLYFTLGNLYADQNRWPDAQQAYFQAHHLQAGNPDYAYNLAIGLEHVGQPKLALEYYRRTLQLVTAGGSANFSADAVQQRIVTLEKTVR